MKENKRIVKLGQESSKNLEHRVYVPKKGDGVRHTFINQNLLTLQNIMTAEELLESKETFDNEYPTVSISDAIEAMIEFAKHHVEAALKKVYEKDLQGITTWQGNPYTNEGSDCLDIDKMLNCYPLENIK